MQNNIIKNITYTAVGILALYVVYSFFSGTFTDLKSGKVNKIEIRNLLKNIKNEADLYYPDNNNYGNINEAYSENGCSVENNFLTNISVDKLFTKLNSKNMKCIFEGQSKILSWSFTVKSENKYYCIDAGGDIKELEKFPSLSNCSE